MKRVMNVPQRGDSLLRLDGRRDTIVEATRCFPDIATFVVRAADGTLIHVRQVASAYPDAWKEVSVR